MTLVLVPTSTGRTHVGVGVNTIMRAYLVDLGRRNLAPETIRRRQRCLALLAAAGDLRTLSPEQISAFLDDRHLHARTRYTWLSHFHSFYEWAVRHGHMATDPTLIINRPKLDRLLPRPISDDDLALALELASREMHAWLTLAAYAGLRCAEIARLERTDINDRLGRLHVLGKGRKERHVPIHPVVSEALERHGLPRRGRVFTRPDGSPRTAQEVSRRGCVYLMEIGADATMHQLRHWFGTSTLAECGDLRVVQELMGHASPMTTAGYAAPSSERAAAAVRALPVRLRTAA